jgi:hypothetical protein
MRSRWEEGEFDWNAEDTVRVLTPRELEIMAKKTERLARQLVDEKFKKIDRQRKMEYKEEKRQKKLEKQKKGRGAENRGGEATTSLKREPRKKKSRKRNRLGKGVYTMMMTMSMKRPKKRFTNIITNRA